MDWHSSGITNSYEFELLNRSLGHVGWLDNVTGGSIVQSYRGDYRVTATLELDGEIPPIDGYVRIWHTASKGGEAVRTCLATLLPDLPGMEYRLGRWTGSLDLYSAMKNLDTCLRTKDGGIGKNKPLAEYWSYIAGINGAVPLVMPGVSQTAKSTRSYVFEFGEPILSSLHVIADALGAYIEVDPEGRVCLAPYVLPSRRSASWTLSSGGDSTMLVGVQREEPEMVNRVIGRYEDDNGKTTYADAMLPASHPWSWAQTGRKVAVSIEPDSMTGSGSSWLQNLAEKELASISSTSSRYEVVTLFDPEVRPGTVGDVAYADSPSDPGLRFRAFCSQREIELDAAMTTTLTLEEMA